ncbi:MAG: FHA domain-containing protein [Myxococcota bacterium]
MGVFQSPHGRRLLRARALLGRDEVCDLRLSSRSSSAHHASLRWNDGVWQIKDLASRNGTFIQGHRLVAGRWDAIARGQSIQLGSADERWTLIDDGPPELFAEERGGAVAEASGGFLALPPEGPAAWVCPSAEGWVLEGEHEVRTVHNRESVRLGSTNWVLALPEPEALTAEADPARRSLDRIVLAFTASSDEETVQIDVIGPGPPTPLRPRSHSFMLLTLARLRERELRDGCDPREAGWVYVDDLERMLDVKPGQINLLVFRARRQLADAGVVDSAGLVERRPGTTRLRLGPVRVRLPAGAHRER